MAASARRARQNCTRPPSGRAPAQKGDAQRDVAVELHFRKAKSGGRSSVDVEGPQLVAGIELAHRSLAASEPALPASPRNRRPPRAFTLLRKPTLDRRRSRRRAWSRSGRQPSTRHTERPRRRCVVLPLSTTSTSPPRSRKRPNRLSRRAVPGFVARQTGPATKPVPAIVTPSRPPIPSTIGMTKRAPHRRDWRAPSRRCSMAEAPTFDLCRRVSDPWRRSFPSIPTVPALPAAKRSTRRRARRGRPALRGCRCAPPSGGASARSAARRPRLLLRLHREGAAR